MSELKQLFENNINIMEYFRKKNNTQINDIRAILASYDAQAGSYVEKLVENNVSSNFHINGEKVSLKFQDYLEKFTDVIADILNGLEYSSILEAGVGEATTFSYLMKKLNNKAVKKFGFDISPSRIQVGQEFASNLNVDANLFVGDINKIPFQDNSIDVVYTVHAIEPNSGREDELVKELFRVCKKYLILVEPSYELGNETTKQNIEKHKYIKKLKSAVDKLDGGILRYELCPVGTYGNQPALYVIKKNAVGGGDNQDYNTEFCCPVCKDKLELADGNYFCERCSLVYPVFKNIPVLNSDSAVLFSSYIR